VGNKKTAGPERVEAKVIKDRQIEVTDDTIPYRPVTHIFGVEGERQTIQGDAKRMIATLSKLIRDAAWNPRSYREETQVQFAVDVAHALVADLEAVVEAVEVDRERDERVAAQALISAKLAAWPCDREAVQSGHRRMVVAEISVGFPTIQPADPKSRLFGRASHAGGWRRHREFRRCHSPGCLTRGTGIQVDAGQRACSGTISRH
jgi:hypothetical protein